MNIFPKIAAVTESTERALLACSDNKNITYGQDIAIAISSQMKSPIYGQPLAVSELMSALMIAGGGKFIFDSLQANAKREARKSTVFKVPRNNQYQNGMFTLS